MFIWKHLDIREDRSGRPQELTYAFDGPEESLILSLRRQGMSLDDLVNAMRVSLPGTTAPLISGWAANS